VTDSSCATHCVCDSGFAGEACEFTVEAFESAQSVRHSLLQAYEVLLASENPTPDVVTSWLEGLAGVAAHAGQLSEASKELLVAMCSSVLDVASTLSMSYEDVVQVERVLSLTLHGGASSSLDSALVLLDKYGLYLVGDLQVGQNPTVVVGPLYRLSVYSVDGLSSRELSMGRSALEVMTGASSQSVTLPVSHGVEPYKVLLMESFSTMQSDASNKELFQSVPVSVYVDAPLCNRSAEVDDCVVSVELSNFEFGEHVDIEAKSFYTSCVLDEEKLVTYSCPSGVNVSAYCNGTMNGVLSANCSVHVPSSSCEAMDIYDSGVKCTALEVTAEATICQCKVPDFVGSSIWKVEYVSVASSYLTNSSLFFTPVPVKETLGTSTTSVELQSFVVMYVVIAFILYIVLLRLSSVRRKDSTEISASATIRTPREYMNSGLPRIFTGKHFLTRMYEELSLHHRWSWEVLRAQNENIARQQCLSIVTIVCFLFFGNSLVHAKVMGFDFPIDAVHVCFVAACLSVLGGPIFIVVEEISRQLRISTISAEKTFKVDDNALVAEYTRIVNNTKACDLGKYNKYVG
jgi:hypothetical protein